MSKQYHENNCPAPRHLSSKACEIGAIVVNKCLDRGFNINTQKLQKLLVLMQADYIKRTHETLFDENIIIRDCGIMIDSVDFAFLKYAIEFTEKQTEYICLTGAQERSVDAVLDKYGTCNAMELHALPQLQYVVKLGLKQPQSKEFRVYPETMLGAFY